MVDTGEGSLDRDLVRILGALLEFANATAALERDHCLPLPMRIGADVALGPATIAALRHHPHAGMHFATNSVSLKGYDAPMLVWAASFDSLRRFVDGCET